MRAYSSACSRTSGVAPRVRQSGSAIRDERDHRQHGGRHHGVQALPRPATTGALVARAPRLGDEGLHAVRGAAEHAEDRPEPDAREAEGAELRGAEATDEDRVDHVHHRLGHLGEHDRIGEQGHLAYAAGGGVRGGRGGGCDRGRHGEGSVPGGRSTRAANALASAALVMGLPGSRSLPSDAIHRSVSARTPPSEIRHGEARCGEIGHRVSTHGAAFYHGPAGKASGPAQRALRRMSSMRRARSTSCWGRNGLPSSSRPALRSRRFSAASSA